MSVNAWPASARRTWYSNKRHYRPAAVISTPIAIQISAQMGIETEAIVLAVLFGANLSFITPIGYQTNLLVYTARSHRFFDFLRTGGLLLLVMWPTLSWLIVFHYGLA